MPEPSPRAISAIDADLRSYRAFRRDVDRELAEFRRRQAELADLEAALIVAIETRCGRVDRLLDERLRAVAAAAEGRASFSYRPDLVTPPTPICA